MATAPTRRRARLGTAGRSARRGSPTRTTGWWWRSCATAGPGRRLTTGGCGRCSRRCTKTWDSQETATRGKLVAPRPVRRFNVQEPRYDHARAPQGIHAGRVAGGDWDHRTARVDPDARVPQGAARRAADAVPEPDAV